MTSDDKHAPALVNTIERGENDLRTHWRTRDPDALHKAVDAFDEVIADPHYVALGITERRRVLQGAGNARLDVYRTSGGHDLLERGVHLLRDAYELCADPERASAGLSNDLAIALRERFLAAQSMDDLNEAIRLMADAVKTGDPDSSALCKYRINLSMMLVDRFLRDADPADIDYAVDAAREALAGAATAPGVEPETWNSLGRALAIRYEHNKRRADLMGAIDAYEHAVSLASHAGPGRLHHRHNLAASLQSLFRLESSPDVLERAIALSRDAVAGAPGNGTFLSTFAHALTLRFQMTGSTHDIHEAVQAYEQAVEHLPPGSAMRGVTCHELGIALTLWFERSAEPQHLERALEALRAAVKSVPAQSLAGALGDLSARLYRAHQVVMSPDALDEAIQAAKRGLAHPSGAGAVRAYLRRFLGQCLAAKYQLTGESGVLDQAVSHLRAAGDALPQSHPDRPAVLFALGQALQDRFLRTGNLQDIDDAVDNLRQGAALIPDAGPERGAMLATLGLAMSYRRSLTGSRADSEQAMRIVDAAQAMTPPGSPQRAHVAGVRGIVLASEPMGEEPDGLGDERLQRKISALREAADLAPPGSPNRPTFLSNLARGLFERYRKQGRIEDLDTAIATIQEVIDTAQGSEAARSAHLCGLADYLRARFEHSGERRVLDQAVEQFERMVEVGRAGSTGLMLTQAIEWGDWAFARQRWDLAGRFHAHAIDAIAELVRVQPLRGQKETWLARTQGSPAACAYALARCGEMREAVLTLERGLALLTDEAPREFDIELERLSDTGHGMLRERYADAARRLASRMLAAQSTLSGFAADPLLAELARRWRDPAPVPGAAQPGAAGDDAAALARERNDLDEAVAAIRALPDFENFRRPPRFEELCNASAGATTVYLLSTDHGGLALTVSRDSGVGEPVWLPHLSAGTMRGLVLGLFGNYLQWRQQSDDEQRIASWLTALDNACGYMAYVAMETLLEVLPARCEVVLVPVGLLALLPWHAARCDDPGSPSGHRYAIDVLKIRYAPTMRALALAGRSSRDADPQSIVAVEQPTPVSAPPLPGAEAEVAAAMAGFDEPLRLAGSSATPGDVLAAIAHCDVLHLCCHGYADLASPLNSGLLLADDQTLSVRELMGHGGVRARLAVLSACETGVPGVALPDEVVNLPAGFLRAGIAGVIASQWSVADRSTTMLMYRFYALWRGSAVGSRPHPAHALRLAQIWLRDTTNGEKLEFFGSLRKQSGDGFAVEAARWAEGELTEMGAADTRAFEHPFYWAAFGYTGR